MATPTEPSSFSLATEFQPNEQGFVRQWVCAGPISVPYPIEEGEEATRQSAIQPTPHVLPQSVTAGGPGPDGRTWTFTAPGGNWLVDRSAHYHVCNHLQMWAATEFVVNRTTDITFRLWTPNTVDIWCGTRHCRRFTPAASGTLTASPPSSFSIPPGHTRIFVYLQELAVRDAPLVFGLELLTQTERLGIALPGDPSLTAQLVQIDRWLDELVPSKMKITAPSPPVAPVDVILDRPEVSIHRSWPHGKSELRWHEDQVESLDVKVRLGDHRLNQRHEIPENRVLSTPRRSVEEHRMSQLRQIAFTPNGDPRTTVYALLARHALDQADRDVDETTLQETLEFVSQRYDGADLRLASLLRLYGLGWGHREQTKRIELVAAGFRYGLDEPGSDVMAFNAEHHAICFSGSQYLAASLIPVSEFSSSGRSRKEQEALGRERCRGWLEKREAFGFDAFMSADLMPPTVAGLLNLVDFAQDTEIRATATRLVDRALRQLAKHSLDGVTAGPQGHVQRQVTQPATSSTQGLLSFSVGEGVVEAISPWSVFLATSPRYTYPDNMDDLVARPITTTYTQAGNTIKLHKTESCSLSSVSVGNGEDGSFKAGNSGRNEHLWHASLGRGAHVFVNHPVAPRDGLPGRHRFWSGNGVLPKVHQERNVLFLLYNLPDDDPMPFTHAHWPVPSFGERFEREGWHFGAVGNGRIGLWCSRPVTPVNGVLTARELRALGRSVGWVCVCGNQEDHGSLNTFAGACIASNPELKLPDGQLIWEGQPVI